MQTQNNHFFQSNESVHAVQWTDKGVKILDQRLLPDQECYELVDDLEGVIQAIQTMKVRGAPAIGITAAYGVVLAAQQHYSLDSVNWKSNVEKDFSRLEAARPTAVNLRWAIQSMRESISSIDGEPSSRLLDCARRIHQDDYNANRKMGALGAEILANANGILTHCNAGALATGGYGTALGVIRSAHQSGLRNIYATETRPWLQGVRLTIWELKQDNIAATLIGDSAAAFLMAKNAIDWVVVGADRIAANGDVANKIGTYSLAIAAKYHDIKLMVVAPTSTIDWTISSGASIEIEQRDKNELLMNFACYGNNEIEAWNPVFDVTPNELIDVIVTENGVVKKPNSLAMNKIR